MTETFLQITLEQELTAVQTPNDVLDPGEGDFSVRHILVESPYKDAFTKLGELCTPLQVLRHHLRHFAFSVGEPLRRWVRSGGVEEHPELRELNGGIGLL